MKKKMLKRTLTSSLILGQLVMAQGVFAADINTDIENAEQTSSSAQNQVDSLSNRLNQLHSSEQSTEDKLQSLNSQISSNQTLIEEALLELENSQASMNNLIEKIDQLESNIAKRKDRLADQARTVQVSGQASNYLEFILNSESITDILGRIDVVVNIIKSNSSLVEEQVKDKEALEVTKTDTGNTIRRQGELVESLEAASQDLEQQRVEQEVLLAQLGTERATVESERQSYLVERDQAIERVEELVAQREEIEQELADQAPVLADQEPSNEELLAQTRQELAQAETSQEQVETEEVEENQETQQVEQVQVAAEVTAEAEEASEPVASPAANSSSTSGQASTVSSQTTNSNRSTSTLNTSNTSSSSSQSSSNNSSSSSSNTNASTSSSSSSSQAQAPAPAPAPAPKPEPKPAPAPAPAASGSVSWSGIQATANSLLGTTYRWGGTTPAGFDCSGFTQYVYRQNGVSIPRDSRSQFAASTRVSNPVPGDLVFFGSGGRVTHVGIYAGGGRYVGSQTSTGVAYTNVHTGYWGSRFMGYGRF